MDRCGRHSACVAALVVFTIVMSAGAQDRQPAGIFSSPGTGMKLTLIRAGGFEMGSLVSEDGHTRGEQQHTTRITQSFYLGIAEVTQAEYETIMARNPSAFAKGGSAEAKVGAIVTRQFPVESVTWFDAIEFCNALSKKDNLKAYYTLDAIERNGDSIHTADVTVIGGSGYRLPTEAEWEYACRGSTTTAYSTGEPIALLGQGAWYGGTVDSPGNSQGMTHRVGLKTSNGNGLFDIHGNVSEWCYDWYDYYAYERAQTKDPLGPSGGSEKVTRGGSWNTPALNCRSAARGAASVSKPSSDIGFRVARTIVVAPPKNRSVPPYRVVIDLRDTGTIDLYINETYDTIEAAKQRLASSKLFGKINNIRIIDANGTTVD
ncbi:MAG TPA: formylglycine-generating enzyme family protein [Schlesneria sp.]